MITAQWPRIYLPFIKPESLLLCLQEPTVSLSLCKMYSINAHTLFVFKIHSTPKSAKYSTLSFNFTE
jgi:hypothetical protein